MPFPHIEPARPPALNDDILRVMQQTTIDFAHGNADPAALEHVLFCGPSIIAELLAWRAAAAEQSGGARVIALHRVLR